MAVLTAVEQPMHQWVFNELATDILCLLLPRGSATILLM
jgi:hypothetical protein